MIITGLNFRSATGASFNGLAAAYNVIDNNTIRNNRAGNVATLNQIANGAGVVMYGRVESGTPTLS